MKLVVLAAIAAMMIASATLAMPVKAEADCDKNGIHLKEQGGVAGNAHECVGGSGDNPEPVRSCDHANSEKDNNGDDFAACIPRGNSDDDD